MIINDMFYKHLTVKNIVFLIATVLMIFFISKNIDLAMVFFASIVIACSLNPLVDKLEKKINRTGAAIIVLGSFILLLLVVLFPILYIGIYEISACTQALTKYSSNIDDFIKMNSFLQSLGISQNEIMAQLNQFAANAGVIIAKTVQFFREIGSAIIYLIISVIFTFFFMADRDNIKNAMLQLFPKTIRKRTEEILNIISQKIGGYIVAQVITMASVGVVMAIGLALFRVDYPILLGLITAILDIIPILGPALALIICLLTTYGNGILPIIGIVISFALAQLIENQAVRPYIFGKLMNVHPILIFTFLFIGAKYFGLLGALFAPAIAAIVCVLIKEIYIKNIE